MAKRKQISKSVRFEVFKRDSFKCQYCGRSAPDVILEVDHIVPVAEGGDNEMINLVTSCMDCNRGKSDRKLTDTIVIDKQKRQLEEMNAIREQTEMMIAWKQEIMNVENTQVDAIESRVSELSGRVFTEHGRRKIKDLIRRFGFSEVYDSAVISYEKYDPLKAFDKIGGICYNRKKWREAEKDAKQNT